MSEWQPIETVPRDGTVILAWRFYVVAMKWTGDVAYPWEAVALGNHPCMNMASNGFHGADNSLTHWMPLPAPPEG